MLIPRADRDRYITASEAMAYLNLAPPQYAELILTKQLPIAAGATPSTRLHDRAVLRQMLVEQHGEQAARDAWRRLEGVWQQEDAASLQTMAATAENLRRKSAGLPPLQGYSSRRDPLQPDGKPATEGATEGSTEPAAAPAPYRAAWDDAHAIIQENWRKVAEQQQAQRIAAREALDKRTASISKAGLQRSKMSADDKARFLDAHGMAEYLRLPQ